ncbi:hypothetical protein RV072_002230 [Vibrio vulnificus]|nr:hypothetical protein [Vibrio vulnificus]
MLDLFASIVWMLGCAWVGGFCHEKGLGAIVAVLGGLLVGVVVWLVRPMYLENTILFLFG